MADLERLKEVTFQIMMKVQEILRIDSEEGNLISEKIAAHS